MASLDAALKTAISMEKTGYDLYMKAAKNTTNKLGSSTLEAIAAKELDHIKAIEQFAAKNLNAALISINTQDKIYYIRPILDKLSKELKQTVTKDSDLEKAYKAALGLERSSYNFYKDLAARSKDPQEKKFFEFLMGEENTHYELLSETLEYLNNPGNWFREKERWIVEGG